MQIREIEDLIFNYFPYEPTEGQRIVILALAEFIANSKPDEVFLLRGYAGTGKTTLLSALVQVAPVLRKSASLLAPTGRAAKVLASYSGKQAFTIHKKIYQPRSQRDGSIIFAKVTNYHKNMLFIVDEASMIQGSGGAGHIFSDADLLTDLIEYVQSGSNCRLILIGDTAQLPPVGLSVSLAMDNDHLRKQYRLNIRAFELKEVMRQSLESGILANAILLREKLAVNKFDFPLFSIDGFKDISRIDSTLLEDALNDAFGSKGDINAVVITSSNKRANIYNREIRRRILYREEEISAGDLMMVVKNNYFWLPADSPAGFIANGDILEVLKVKRIITLYGFRFATSVVRLVDYPDQAELEVNLLLNTLTAESPALTQLQQQQLFDAVMMDYVDIPNRRRRIEKVKNNPWFNALQVKFAYALTCHKTQGGQWETIFIDQPWLKDGKISNEYLRWLYTAVTRATKKTFLVNFKDEFFA
jgi:ATP-dependent exoDNAse (exonuclease V) alpha subunit